MVLTVNHVPDGYLGVAVETGRYLGHSPKWQQNNCGPFLVTKVLGLVDVVMERTSRFKPQVVQFDKLKQFLGKP